MAAGVHSFEPQDGSKKGMIPKLRKHPLSVVHSIWAYLGLTESFWISPSSLVYRMVAIAITIYPE